MKYKDEAQVLFEQASDLFIEMSTVMKGNVPVTKTDNHPTCPFICFHIVSSIASQFVYEYGTYYTGTELTLVN